MPTREQVVVPPQHRIGAHQQPHLAQHATRETVQQRGQERPVARGEPCSLLAELAFQHHELMAQGEDLDVLAVVAHRQQAQHRERVRHTQIGQSQQHGRPSCRGDHQPREYPAPRQTLTCMDEVSGKHSVPTALATSRDHNETVAVATSNDRSSLVTALPMFCGSCRP
ncbi:hypothetical protein [Streptomyces bluensis]|uniref:hypothetical protein n=1 Tax=Streptomyces bluensis TaxID=33897 RepID=UPI00332CB50C